MMIHGVQGPHLWSSGSVAARYACLVECVAALRRCSLRRAQEIATIRCAVIVFVIVFASEWVLIDRFHISYGALFFVPFYYIIFKLKHKLIRVFLNKLHHFVISIDRLELMINL